MPGPGLLTSRPSPGSTSRGIAGPMRPCEHPCSSLASRAGPNTALLTLLWESLCVDTLLVEHGRGRPAFSGEVFTVVSDQVFLHHICLHPLPLEEALISHVLSALPSPVLCGVPVTTSVCRNNC